ncbi:penicillin-binding protein 2 [Alkalihalobacillus sp. AL-G]|uniref:peptidoglycan D,D-transpeptidase FtsI family protein n=1 Tax=Alkalihalobacillus sp. AL-G TaxID=2926399 RepID=UPI00272B7872|nr:penicillin-binding protein 2 [Alkalihalobacillus sp. AL-G]WLD93921.1 penicillin-binding protein 2 [Alkalihalobacillus sp. AL-G]
MEQLETKKKKKNFLPLRLNLLFLFVFLLFGLLIIRLGFVQIVNGDYFRTQSELTKTIQASVQTERGKMFDRHGRLLVGNEPSFALTYIRVQGVTQEDHIRYADKLSEFIDMPIEDVTESDLKDYWIAEKGLENAFTLKLTEEELDPDNLSNEEQYELLRERITAEDLKPITSDDHLMEVVAIKRELDKASNLNITYVKKGLKTKEVARIGEHLGELEGRFSIASASDRVYPNGYTFYYGHMGAIPAELLDQYLLRGYAQNNEVGTSYLEKKYEGLLSGREKTFTFTTTKSLQPIGNPKVSMGSRGYDLVLSIDIALQKKIGEILERKIIETRNVGEGPVTSAYAVMMNPNTGEVLAMVGRELEDGKFTDDSYATLQKSFEVGSTVKGATILAVHQLGDRIPSINDKTIRLGQADDFSSYTPGIGWVDDIEALEQSSNVYMGMSIGRIAGFQFANTGGAYQARVFNNDRYRTTFQNLRDVYAQVGLGVKTGIDLPEEGLGYEGPISQNPGVLLYYTIGQYDTYTPIQMAQYVSTIANGGYRVQPHLLKEVRKSTGTNEELGPLISEYETQVINRIDNTTESLKRVQQGFYQVTHGNRGTARGNGPGGLSDTKIAGKTGTAQIDGPGRYNLTFVGYAPYDDPEVAFSVIVPNLNSGHVNVEIAKEIVKAYQESKSPQPETSTDKENEDAQSDS